MVFNKELDLFNKVIQLIPGNIYWKDRQGRYLGCNFNQLQITHLTSLEDLIGKSDFDLYDVKIAKKVYETDKNVMETGTPITFEEEGVDINGSPAIYLTNKQPLFDENQNVYGLIGISINITEKKMADQLKAMKSAFIQNMEHDIRTPCGGIWGMVDYLDKTESDPIKKESLHLVAEAAKKLLDYNNRIIEFAQMQTEAWPITAKPCDITTLLKKIVKLEQPAAVFKKIKLTLEQNTLISIIIIDEHRLYSIAINLISNAIKFTEIGEVKISLNLLDDNKNSKKALLELVISDTGIGIPQDKINLIGIPFNRLNPSNQNKYPGIGLGLAMVKQFIEDLKGKLEITSELKKGSTFRVTIPVTKNGELL